MSGEVHALVGENGAGKSTLIKVMTGIYQPDEGSITIDGVAAELTSSAEAQARGIVAIYQEPMIYPDLSVAENIFIGHRNRGRLVHWRRMYDEADAILRSLAIDVDARAPANTLAVAAQQAVEIAKAISLDARVLIMDEPTASLSAHEVDRLFDQVGELRRRGVAVLFISHRLDEVFRIADRITVFRDGRHISTRPVADTSRDRLVREMVGRDFGDFFVRTRHQPGETALRVEELGRAGTFEDVNFEVHAGEVVGFAGLVGAGRTEVGLALFGIAPAESGGSSSTAASSDPQPGRSDAARHRLPLRGPAAARLVDAAVGGIEHHAAGDPQLPHTVRPARSQGRGSGRRRIS